MSKITQSQIADMQARYHEIFSYTAPEYTPTLEQYVNYKISRGEKACTKPRLIWEDMHRVALREEGGASLAQSASAAGVEKPEESIDLAGLNSSVNDCDIPQE